jgi:two-component system, OmpR family, heavy metal sensor histidine kinase CusS
VGSATASARRSGGLWAGRRSFRLRIALLSMLSSGILLAAFGLSAFILLRSASLHALDSDLQTRVRGGMVGPGPVDRWQRLETDLGRAPGGGTPQSPIVLARDPGGQVLYRSAKWPADLPPERLPAARPEPPPGPPPGPGPDDFGGRRPHVSPPVFATFRAGGHQWRVMVVGSDQGSLALGVDLAVISHEMARAGRAFTTAVPIALVLVGILGWLVSNRALSPVRKLMLATERIDVTALDQRIHAEGEDVEFARLITVFNDMLDRLSKSFAQARRFSADAAHELKTPLMILQGELEAGLQAAAEGSDEQLRYADLLEEVQRLKSIVSNLLTLSIADAGKLLPRMTLHNLSAAVGEVIEEAEIIGEGLTIAQDIAPEVWVMADPSMVLQVVRNLATNAIRHNRKGGEVSFSLREKAAGVELRVSNSGGGIRSEDAERIFERFYRGDQSRGRTTDGVGLGLSLSRELVRAQGGELVLEASTPGQTTFLMTLPRAPRAG